MMSDANLKSFFLWLRDRVQENRETRDNSVSGSRDRSVKAAKWAESEDILAKLKQIYPPLAQISVGVESVAPRAVEPELVAIDASGSATVVSKVSVAGGPDLVSPTSNGPMPPARVRIERRQNKSDVVYAVRWPGSTYTVTSMELAEALKEEVCRHPIDPSTKRCAFTSREAAIFVYRWRALKPASPPEVKVEVPVVLP